MNNKIKQHNSCVRVLEFLKLLFGEDIDIKDINRTNSREFGDIEATETFLKYIYTLEASGLEIEKIDEKYSLCSYFSQIDLNEREEGNYSLFCRCGTAYDSHLFRGSGIFRT